MKPVKLETFRKSVVDSSRESIQDTTTEQARRNACAVVHLSESPEVFLENVRFPPDFLVAWVVPNVFSVQS